MELATKSYIESNCLLIRWRLFVNLSFLIGDWSDNSHQNRKIRWNFIYGIFLVNAAVGVEIFVHLLLNLSINNLVFLINFFNISLLLLALPLLEFALNHEIALSLFHYIFDKFFLFSYVNLNLLLWLAVLGLLFSQCKEISCAKSF